MWEAQVRTQADTRTPQQCQPEDADAMDAAAGVDAKAVQYEAYVNDVLKEDLRRLHRRRERLASHASDYAQLHSVLLSLREAATGPALKTQVNLGCDFYVQARVADASALLLDVGLGLHLQVSADEALGLVERRRRLLTAQLRRLAKDAANTKAMIKLVLGGLHELQGLR